MSASCLSSHLRLCLPLVHLRFISSVASVSGASVSSHVLLVCQVFFSKFLSFVLVGSNYDMHWKSSAPRPLPPPPPPNTPSQHWYFAPPSVSFKLLPPSVLSIYRHRAAFCASRHGCRAYQQEQRRRPCQSLVSVFIALCLIPLLHVAAFCSFCHFQVTFFLENLHVSGSCD